MEFVENYSKAELTSRYEAINKSNAVINFDLEGNIIYANDIFLQTVGYKDGDQNKIKGRHHSIFVSPDYSSSKEYKDFWEKLGQGKFYAGEFERIKKDGSKIYLQATYNPIINEDGKTYAVMKIASDITKSVEDKNKIENLKVDLELQLKKSEELKSRIEVEKDNALNDLDVLIKKSQSELISNVVRVALFVIMGVGVITTFMYALAIYTSTDTQIIGSTWSNMFGILLTNAFSIVGTIMGVKYATEKDDKK